MLRERRTCFWGKFVALPWALQSSSVARTWSKARVAVSFMLAEHVAPLIAAGGLFLLFKASIPSQREIGDWKIWLFSLFRRQTPYRGSSVSISTAPKESRSKLYIPNPLTIPKITRSCSSSFPSSSHPPTSSTRPCSPCKLPYSPPEPPRKILPLADA